VILFGIRVGFGVNSPGYRFGSLRELVGAREDRVIWGLGGRKRSEDGGGLAHVPAWLVA